MTLPDLPALWLTLRLALTTTGLLLLIGTPLAWWLATTRTRAKPVIEALVALPLVLPPTVLGFYLLIAFNPDSPIGSFWLSVTGDTLTFSFAGLVIASVIYSLPFMVQPLQTAFETTGRSAMELAASLRAAPLDAFFTVAMPGAARGFVTAIVLSFAHTLGEFGVVLMVGGNIPERTRVISIAIYEHVDNLAYAEAHTLSAILLGLSFIVLLFVYAFNRRFPVHAH
ncbi:molybdate ABC transporter permease subunit [Henriciella aquimarina]|uniref:molybdate ABC transporter permease subunit n=1 Tax=Henriciella aquimarina TaxID=545261 RepID=UPI000A035A14|nr:molybdate ABC transporter permease subunit [Henriciella aquimarina]